MADDIISFIEHPTDSTKIIAAASNQLVVINHHGDCTVVAGVQLQGCAYQSNGLYFFAISHFIYAHFTKLKVSHSLFNKSAILVADESNHCVRFLILKNLSSFEFDNSINDYHIGKCGSFKNELLTENLQSSVDPKEMVLSAPKYLSLYHDSETIRLVVNCVLTEVYSVTVSIYSTHTIAYEYSGHPGYVTDVSENLYWPILRSQGFINLSTDNSTSLNQILIINGSYSTTAYYHCDFRNSSAIPRLFQSWPLVIANGKLKSLVYNSTNSEIRLNNINIANISTETPPEFTQFTTAKESNQLILYSQSLKKFYYAKAFSRYQKMLEMLCSFYTIKIAIVSGPESCAYICYKYGSQCVAFSVNNYDNSCYIHNYFNLDHAYPFEGSACYLSMSSF